MERPPQPPVPEKVSSELRVRLREEVEAPFRKVRQFLYAAGMLGASVAGYVALSEVVPAALRGDVHNDTFINALSGLGVDVGGLALLAALYRLDDRAAAKRLERLNSGAQLAALRLEAEPGGPVRALSSLRSNYLVTLYVGPTNLLMEMLREARSRCDELVRRSCVIVPFVTDAGAAPAGERRALAQLVDECRQASDRFWLATPLFIEEWRSWIESERSRAGNVRDDDCLTFIVKSNGKVGTRIRGLARMARLLPEVDRLRRGLRLW